MILLQFYVCHTCLGCNEKFDERVVCGKHVTNCDRKKTPRNILLYFKCAEEDIHAI